jgi:hypothetical protein
MIEAVENHMPEVVVIDEIGTELEAGAARTIAERGVQLVGTAHGNTLENLMLNPTLSDLVGGIQSVTLSDEEARRRGTQKSVLERKAPSTFGIVVEILERDKVAVVPDVAGAVDALLRDLPVRREIRQRSADGGVDVVIEHDDRRTPSLRRNAEVSRATRPQADEQHIDEASGPAMVNPLARGRGTSERPLRIFPFGVSRNRLEQAISSLGVPGVIVRELSEADMVITLRNYYRQRPRPLREAESRGVALYVLRSNTVVQMVNLLRDLMRDVEPENLPDDERAFNGRWSADEVTDAMFETEEAIHAVMGGMAAVELRPQAHHIRRLQHQLAERYNVGSRSRGREPHRRVEIHRMGAVE